MIMVSISQKGFTLIEIISVLLIASLLTLVAITQSALSSSTELDMAAKGIVSDLYLTQEIGLVHHQTGRIAFINGASGYSIRQGNNVRVYKTVDLPAGVSITSGDLDFRFRLGGQPAILVGASLVFTTAIQSITISSSSASRTIDVYPQTAYSVVR